MDPLDIDPSFEPQTRARSNTWPLPRPENFVEADEKGPMGHLPLPEAPKKNSSRRNAWGNMSYADLITQAIQSSPEKRLTLAQIYEWMVQNVAYFKDKGDSNSSAGWKNSIRHNLSLHNRFMRVQNEGTGKSSWWMINPDAKPGKAARRRATSMETSKYEKKRGRVKKKVEALRQGCTPSPSSSVSGEGQDLFPDSPGAPLHFQLSPDFRPRASSNASSCGGRLSPIPAAEGELHDGDMPPLSPIPWATHLGGYEPQSNSLDRFTTDHLVKSLTESMKLRNGSSASDPAEGGFGRMPDCAVPNGRPSPQMGATGSYPMGAGGGAYYGANGRGGGAEYRPPAYQPPAPSQEVMGVLAKRHSPPQQQQVIETVNGRSYTLTRLQNISHPHPTQLDGLQSYRSLSYMDGVESVGRGQQPSLYKEIKEERLSPLMAPAPTPYHHPQHMMHQQQQNPQQPSSASTSLVNTANHVVGHLLYNALPQDLDFEPLPGGLECDVDQVIRHELSVDGNLDFNFDSSSMNGSSANSQHHQAITSTRSWVH